MMKKIILACAGGFSTSMLMSKMRDAALEAGHEVNILAIPENDIHEHTDSDIILLGPQISHLLEDIQKEVNIPVEVINSLDYGMMNGSKVFEEAWNKIK